MASSFLEQLYDTVRDELNDPHLTKRITDAMILRDFQVSEKKIWELLLMATGQESTLGRVELAFSLLTGISRYPLPGNFRQFLSLEQRDVTFGTVTAKIPSIPMFDPGPGIEIVADNRMSIVRPTPMLDSNWILVYQKGPVITHYATSPLVKNSGTAVTMTGYTIASTSITKTDAFTAAMANKTITFTYGGTTVQRTILTATNDVLTFATLSSLPAVTDTYTVSGDFAWVKSATATGGTLICTADYYNGCILNVYDATAGTCQAIEIADYYLEDSVWTFVLAKQFDTLPTGTIKYEIRPALPPDYDRLYAIDVAIKYMATRGVFARRKELRIERSDLMKACVSLYSCNVADRMPGRTRPTDVYAQDPYD